MCHTLVPRPPIISNNSLNLNSQGRKNSLLEEPSSNYLGMSSIAEVDHYEEPLTNNLKSQNVHNTGSDLNLGDSCSVINGNLEEKNRVPGKHSGGAHHNAQHSANCDSSEVLSPNEDLQTTTTGTTGTTQSKHSDAEASETAMDAVTATTSTPEPVQPTIVMPPLGVIPGEVNSNLMMERCNSRDQ